jgi:hypothetical protein
MKVLTGKTALVIGAAHSITFMKPVIIIATL